MTPQPDKGPSTEDAASLRPLLVSIAYGMTGEVHVAEDLAQEALVRCEEAVGGGFHIDSPKAFACAVVTRLAIDRSRSARHRRETYVGEWLPEPVVVGIDTDPAAQAELGESLSMALLTLLERLSPLERAVFLLHDVFGFSFDEVARQVQRSAANCRQVAVRGRRHLVEARARFTAPPESQRSLADRFLVAARNGEVDELASFLADDVALHGDGGGLVPAVRRPLHGRAPVASTVIRFVGIVTRRGAHIRSAWVNGGPGFVTTEPDGTVSGVVALELDGDRIVALRSIVNPNKLRHLNEAVQQ